MLIEHVSRKNVHPLDPIDSNTCAPFNRTIHTVAEVHCLIVPVKGLLRLESSMPRAIRSLASKSARGTSMRATAGVMGKCYYDTVFRITVLGKRRLLTCYQSTCGIGRRSWGE